MVGIGEISSYTSPTEISRDWVVWRRRCRFAGLPSQNSCTAAAPRKSTGVPKPTRTHTRDGSLSVAVRWVQPSGRFAVIGRLKTPKVRPQHRHRQRFSKFKLVAVLEGQFNVMEVHMVARHARDFLRDASLAVKRVRR